MNITGAGSKGAQRFAGTLGRKRHKVSALRQLRIETIEPENQIAILRVDVNDGGIAPRLFFGRERLV